ncbi:MAG: phage tail tip lysozyme [Candidatus Saccharimonadales bacterium]
MKKRIHRILTFLVTGLVIASSTSSIAAADESFFIGNGIFYYNGATEEQNDNTTCNTSSVSGTVNPNAKKIWSWFMSEGMSEFGAAGIMGNMQVESAFNPFRLQVANEDYDSLTSNSEYNKAFGLVQWDGGRRVEVLRYIGDDNPEYKKYINLEFGELPDSYKNAPNEIVDAFIELELDFIKQESTDGGNRSTVWNKMISAASAEEASDVFEEIFEGSVRKAGGSHSIAAAEIYANFAGSCSTYIGEGGLTEEQARQFMMNYGEDKNGDTTAAINSGIGTPSSGCSGGLLSNCTSLSAFFASKFSSDSYMGGDGYATVDNMGKAGVPTGSKPQLYSIFSWSNSTYGHTGVVLGIHGDTVIVGHASCSNTGTGKGNGLKEGGGAGFISVGKINEATAWLGVVPTEFAYPRNVNQSKIEAYVSGSI